MFHSHANKEIDFFLKWRNDIPGINFHLIKGNHDILSDKFYEEANIKIEKKKLSIKNFCFTHDITSIDEDDEKVIYFFRAYPPGHKSEWKWQAIFYASLLLF